MVPHWLEHIQLKVALSTCNGNSSVIAITCTQTNEIGNHGVVGECLRAYAAICAGFYDSIKYESANE